VAEKNPHVLNISNLAGAYRAKGVYEKAKEVLQEYLASHPDNTTIRRGLAWTYVCQRKFDMALQETEKAFSLDPTNYNVTLMRGHIFLFRGELDRAEEEYTKLLEFPHPVASFSGSSGLTGVYGIQGKSRNILELNRKMIQGVMGFGQKNLEFRVRLGMSYGYLFSGNLDEAWKEIEILKNLALEEENLGWERLVLFTEGFYYAEEGLLDEAQNAADEMKKKIDESINKYGMRFYYTLIGKIELEQNNFPEAIELLKKAVSMLPAESSATQLQAAFFNILAEAYYMAGDFENAREQYEQIQKMTWGRLNIGGSYTNSFYMLGMIHEQLGDTPKAMEYYEKALDLCKDADPGIPEVADARTRLRELQKQ
jgi:tetratricopeptide (TPR) repeat protein